MSLLHIILSVGSLLYLQINSHECRSPWVDCRPAQLGCGQALSPGPSEVCSRAVTRTWCNILCPELSWIQASYCNPLKIFLDLLSNAMIYQFKQNGNISFISICMILDRMILTTVDNGSWLYRLTYFYQLVLRWCLPLDIICY